MRQSSKTNLAGTLLGVFIVVSALGLIYSSHLCRGFYAQLQDLEANRWALQEDYSRLLLEHSTLASPHRVARIASEDLDMEKPLLDPARVLDSSAVKRVAE